MAPRRQRSPDTTELNTPGFKETVAACSDGFVSVLRWLILSDPLVTSSPAGT